jgi:hypothetical protein
MDIWWDEGEVFRQIGNSTYGPFKTEKEAEEFMPEKSEDRHSGGNNEPL